MRGCLLCLSLVVAAVAHADEKDEMAVKQKATALTVLKRLDIVKPAVVETPDLIVTGNLPEDRLKALAEPVQKQFATVMKALKFEMTDNPPKGKVAVYFLTERKLYSAFVSDVLKEQIERDERAHVSAVGIEPFIVVSVLPGEKPTDLDVEALNQVAIVLLQAKAGVARLPYWMEEGFARAVKWRTTPAVGTAERAKAKLLLTGKGKFKAADAWLATTDKDRPLVAAALMDYLTYGPGSANLGKLLAGFRVPEDEKAPGIDAVLMGVDLTPEKLDAALKKWLLTGK